MVNISDFFNKNKKKLPTAKSSATNSRTSSSASKAPEIINLDDSDEDDDLEELIQKPPRKRQLTEAINEKSKAIENSKEEKPVPVVAKAKPVKSPRKAAAPKPKPKSKATGESITAQDVLDKIPSLDLSKVHVKENITFDFKAGGASTAGDDSLVDVPTDFPEGQPNCLLGLTIVFTGVLPTLERGESEASFSKEIWCSCHEINLIENICSSPW